MKSPKRIAVMAHFDAAGDVPPRTQKLIRQLLNVAERVVVVSTGIRPDAAELTHPRITLISRRNVGYDFYSFKVGIGSIRDLWAYDELILANDSIYIIDERRFADTFQRMSSVVCDMWTMTVSRQVELHAQSYFVVLKKSLFFTRTFIQFWRDVRVVDSKWELILNYEVGMTRRFIAQGARVASAYEPTWTDYLIIAWRLAGKGRLPHLIQFFVELAHWRRVRASNLTHYLWDSLARKLGFIKCELLRDNPNGVAVRHLASIVGADHASEIGAEMARVKRARGIAGECDAVVGIRSSVNPVLPEFRLSEIDANDLRSDVAVVIHLYHVDLAEEINGYLNSVVVPVDIFISVKSVADYIEARRIFSERGRKVHLYVHENIGRDVGPFMSLLNSGLLARYICVCKIHSKKSVYSAKGRAWRDSLFESLLGDSYRVLKIIDVFRRNSECGIIGPEDAFITHSRFWGGNEARLRALAARLGIDDSDVALGFFAGTMFWFRPAALEGLRALNIQISDFEPEAGQRDATLAHVLERAFSLAAKHVGFYSASTAALGRPIDPARYATRGVMVLDQ